MKRGAYAVLGLVLVGVALADVITQRSGWWQLIVFAVAPDLSMLVGGGKGLQRGQLHPRAVPIYNAVHRFWAPAVLVAIALLLRDPGWLSAGLAWSAHIAIDRSLGFGLRTREGFQRTQGA
ncbi:MAG TPA: DUF4260 family protein [Candidatus Dormibacteraeota bacterium]|nr:DUF4260 family protein [Candidatus Dormibacteraeota bacterium]